MSEYGGLWKLIPYRKEKIWAGRRLERRYGGEHIGEAYLLSDQPEAFCSLRDGTSFPSLWQQMRTGKDSPALLVKAIDAAGALSVQVHPLPEQGRGKDELWLIDHVYSDAEVYIGFRQDVTESLCRRRCAEGKLLSLLRPVAVSPGDMLFIPGGTVHAAKGISFYEIQHNFDVTYRLEDYGRGRELQREAAFSVLDFSKSGGFRCRLEDTPAFSFGTDLPFDLERITFRGAFCRQETEPCCFLVVEGSGFCNGERFESGDCFFGCDVAQSLWEGRGTLLRLGSL